MKNIIDKKLKHENKTRYWLSNQIGITYQNLCKLCDNKTTSIKFDLLESICIALDCTPNDILVFERNKNDTEL